MALTLYCFPAACSLAVHILLEELKLPYELKLLKKGGTPELWVDLKKLNPLEQVPTLITQEGYTLTEGAAIYQYLDSKAPGKIFPASGESRFRAFEWVNFTTTSLHKGFGPLFGPEAYTDRKADEDAVKRAATRNLLDAITVAEGRFPSTSFLFGERFMAPDAYLSVVLGWTRPMKIDLSPFPRLQAFLGRMREVPAVQAARTQEGLGV